MIMNLISVPQGSTTLDVLALRYRAAFDNLLDCADGSAPAATCRANWRRDAGSLVTPGDAELADSLLDYYIGQILRAPKAHRLQYCHDGAPR